MKRIAELPAGALALCLGLLPLPAQEVPDSLTFNFRGAPIETVLDYLSEAAGFIIVLETDVRGEITAWSRQPISSEDAVALLNTVLADKGYAAVRNGRILKIVDQDEARRYNLPVRSGSDPRAIPADDQMVTQIIPVRYTDATQLIENLSPLLPEEATMTANQSSNSIILTDRQASVNRIVRIISALDTSISGISAIRVFALQYADASELEDIIEDIFEPPPASRNSRDSGRGGFPFGFGRGGDREGGSRNNNNSSGSSEARQASLHVEAESDERTNSLVVAAPEEYMPVIEEVVAQIDRNVEDVTEIQVFRLEHADATETATIVTSLFGEQDQQTAGGFRFGRFGGGVPPFFNRGGEGDRGGRSRGGNNDDNDRLQQQNEVAAVADPRTNSVIVIASRGMMPQIGQMIGRLDSDSSRKQKVYVYSLDHADVDNVAEILRGMFEDRLSGTSRAVTRNNQQQNNPLNNRTVNAQTIGGFGQ